MLYTLDVRLALQPYILFTNLLVYIQHKITNTFFRPGFDPIYKSIVSIIQRKVHFLQACVNTVPGYY